VPNGIKKTRSISRSQSMRFLATLLGLTLVIVALSVNDAVGQDASQQKKGDPAEKHQPLDEAVTKLLKTQLQAAQKAYRAGIDTMEVKRVGDLLVLAKGNQHARPDIAYIWSVRWLNAQRNLSGSKDERIAAFVDHLKRTKELQEKVKTLVGDGNGGLLPASEAPAAEWYLAEAELWLLKERGK
jgi:hypothetical protein